MPLCRCLPHETPVLLRFFLSGLSPPPPDAPPGSLCPPHGVVRLPHGTPVLLRFFPFPGFLSLSRCSSRLPLSAAWGCPFAAWDTRPFAFFPFRAFSAFPGAPPAPRRPSRCGSDPKKGMPLESGIPVRAGPVSRVLFPGRTPGPCHLSRAAVSCRLKQPTPRHRASNP